MNLRNFANIIKRNTKSDKTKSPRNKGFLPRLDIFLIISLLILAVSPFVVFQVNEIKTENQKINLFISPEFEELFGKELTEKIIGEFNEANPGVRVRIFKYQENKEPDIVIFDENEAALSWKAEKNMPELASLDIYLGHETDAGREPVFKIPLVTFMDVLFYNIDILSGAGFDRPPRTRGEYQTYLKTAEDSGYYSDDLFTPENNIPMNRKLGYFADGKAAMIIGSTRSIPYIRERLGDESFNITAIPTEDRTAGRYDINLTGIYAGINANSLHTEESWRFIEFLLKYRAIFCENFKAVPGTVSDAIPGDYIYEDEFYSKAWDIFEYNLIITGE